MTNYSAPVIASINQLGPNMIFCFSSINSHFRVYVVATSVDDAITKETEVWEHIKLNMLACGDAWAANAWYDTKEEENTDRDHRMAGWTDHSNWSATGTTIAVDSHY